MRDPVEQNIINNLKNWDFDIASYPMPKKEAEIVMNALKYLIEGENDDNEQRKP